MLRRCHDRHEMSLARWHLCLMAASAIAGSSVAEAQVYVSGYTRRDGTYVAPHYRSSPNSTTADNYSTRGNVNPYTGKPGTQAPASTISPSGYALFQTELTPSVAAVASNGASSFAPTAMTASPAPVSKAENPAPPAILTGSDVYDHCRPEASERDRTTCLGYLNGINDATIALAEAGLVVKPFCFPDDMTVGELALYTADTIRRNRDHWNVGAGLAVMTVWLTGYPCPRS